MTQTFSIVLTDVVDSTLVNSTVGDAVMTPLWESHDAESRQLIQEWRGREIGRTDGFLVLFQAAGDAVFFALAYHRMLSTLTPPLTARVGIHRGELLVRENSEVDRARGAPTADLDGLALPAAARIMSIAEAGQTLLSSSAYQGLMAEGVSPDGLARHGHWRFKGVLEPIELYEVGEPGAPFTPPHDGPKAYCVVSAGSHWLPRRELRHTLPAERDTFVGREAPLQQLATYIDCGARLVSLTGMGGMGKTRLATHFGWRWLGEFAGGVWFCDLSQAHSIDGIVHAVARGLELQLGRSDPVEQLGRAMAARGRCLVILDNVEQVTHLAREALGEWLDRAYETHFVVTTREVLSLPGERVVDLPPLPMPDGENLFVQRAGASVGVFAPTAADHQAIATLVRLLDGLPLAIELAAARVRVMAPRALLERMTERFRLLSKPAALGDRQSTLRRAIDWSWDLLLEPERMALSQLSVFEGGFTLTAAEAVLDVPSGTWPADLVQSLVEKSFVRRLGDYRLGLLQSVQAYAAERLQTVGSHASSGPTGLADARARHWRYFAGFVESAALADGCIEAENLVAACRRAMDAGETGFSTAALEAVWFAIRITGPFRVAIELAQRLAELPGLAEIDRSRVDLIAGCAAFLVGDLTHARARLEGGVTRIDANLQPVLAVKLWCALCDLHMIVGELDPAQRLLSQALQVAQTGLSPALQYTALNGLGALAMQQGEIAAARSHYESALALAQGEEDNRWTGGLLSNLGAVAYSEGRLDDARDLYERALVHGRNVGDRRWAGAARCNLALLHHEQGRHELSIEQFASALTSARELGHLQLEGMVLCNLGIVHETRGDLQEACECLEAALRTLSTLGSQRAEGQVRGYLGRVYSRCGRTNEARICLDTGEAQLRAGADPLSLALLLCSRAEAESMTGYSREAHSALQEAEAIARACASSDESELGRALTNARRAATGPC